MLYCSKQQDLDFPLLNSILCSNDAHLNRALDLVLSTNKKHIAVLGLSFKAGTDDLRESPIVKMVESLHGRGYQIKIYDPYVSIASVRGANRDYIVSAIPHIHKMLTTDFQEFLDHSRTIVIGNQSPLIRGLLKKVDKNRSIVDLVNLMWRRRGKSGQAGAVSAHPSGKAKAVSA